MAPAKKTASSPLLTGTLNRKVSMFGADLQTIVWLHWSRSGNIQAGAYIVLKGKGIHVRRAIRPGTTVPSLHDSRTD
jgi:hypothetical protein